MGTFTASLRTIGDVHALPATVELTDGQLSIASGETSIGSWQLADIHLEPIPTGYRMAAEGDQILIELKDIESFQEALKAGKKRRLRLPEKKSKSAPAEDSPRSPAPSASAQTAERTEPPQSPTTVALPPSKTAPPAKKKTGAGTKGLAFVDGTLKRASNRFGPYLPAWVFTRLMFGVAFVALILMVVLPGLVSAFLLIAGALLVVFGAVVYGDTVLASRWLPGRTQPPHVLLFGVAILMMGVLLGLIAN